MPRPPADIASADQAVRPTPSDGPDAATPKSTEQRPPAPLAVDGEYYFDGPLFVFTAAYHRRRGYCCGNRCRHCPYDAEGNIVPGKGE